MPARRRVPVVIVGDIERGGVIASLIGTHSLLSPEERALVSGYIVNKFRGDATLFAPAIDEIASRTGMKCFGIVPYFPEARRLPAEDGVVLDSAPWRLKHDHAPARPIRIAVPRLPRIANFDDLDPLIAEPDVIVDFVEAGRALPLDADAIVIPGSKATLSDLDFLRAQGWDIDLHAFARQGGTILGICGGFQMLGNRIADPEGIEGPKRESEGLGLLAVDTVLTPHKQLRQITGAETETGAVVSFAHFLQRRIPMLSDQTFAFIGSGAMGEAMIKGLITQANLPPQQIIASDARAERGLELAQKYGVRHTTDNLAAVNGATIVVLSVKPQVLHDVLKQLAGHIAPEALVLSIVAGARTEVITNLLQHTAVARSMPNTPAQIGLGMTVWTCPEAMSQLHRDQAKAVFSSIGEEVFVNDERYIGTYCFFGWYSIWSVIETASRPSRHASPILCLATRCRLRRRCACGSRISVLRSPEVLAR